MTILDLLASPQKTNPPAVCDKTAPSAKHDKPMTRRRRCTEGEPLEPSVPSRFIRTATNLGVDCSRRRARWRRNLPCEAMLFVRQNQAGRYLRRVRNPISDSIRDLTAGCGIRAGKRNNHPTRRHRDVRPISAFGRLIPTPHRYRGSRVVR
jgi:hypothetical protein